MRTQPGAMRRAIVLVSALSLVSLTGCESLKTTLRAKETQGALIGGLLGVGTLGLIGSASDHHSGLGGWIGIGAAAGALAGWYAGHLLAQQEQKTH